MTEMPAEAIDFLSYEFVLKLHLTLEQNLTWPWPLAKGGMRPVLVARTTPLASDRIDIAPVCVIFIRS